MTVYIVSRGEWGEWRGWSDPKSNLFGMSIIDKRHTFIFVMNEEVRYLEIQKMCK